MVDRLRAELEHYIDLYGRQDPRTIAKSQEIDIEILKVMKS